MSYKINRRAFLRATTVASALAASSAVVLGVPTALNSTTEESSVLTVENQEPNIDFSKEFTGEGLDYRPVCYWPHINFLNKDNEFLEASGGDVCIAYFFIKSSIACQSWILARETGGKIYYQAISDIDDHLVYTQPFVSSEMPLTLGELTEFIDGSRLGDDIYPGGIMESNWEAGYDGDFDPRFAVRFIDVSSLFYPGLEAHYSKVADSWVAEKLEERTEFDDEYEV